jgi:hypothetical protein
MYLYNLNYSYRAKTEERYCVKQEARDNNNNVNRRKHHYFDFFVVDDPIFQ